MASSSTPLRAPQFEDIDEETGLPVSELRALLADEDDDPSTDVDGEEVFAMLRERIKQRTGKYPEEWRQITDGQ